MIRPTTHKTQIEDIDLIVSIESDIQNSKFITPNTPEEHKALIIDENIEHLLLKQFNHIIGFVILSGVKDKNNSIEFRRIVIKEKGRGLGRKSIQEIKRYCFEELDCHRLWLDVLESNVRARHLYSSENFKEEGTLRECLVAGDDYHSLIIMSILENEYRSEKSQVT